MSDLTITIILLLVLALALAGLVWGDARLRKASGLGLLGALAGLAVELLRREDATTTATTTPDLRRPEMEALDRMATKTDAEVIDLEEEIDAIIAEDKDLHRPGDAPGDVAAGSRFAERLRERGVQEE
jgi:hypothetical protein